MLLSKDSAEKCTFEVKCGHQPYCNNTEYYEPEPNLF